MINQIKNLRINLDGLSQLVKELKPIRFINHSPRNNNINTLSDEDIKKYHYLTDAKIEYGNSKEIDKAYDSLILAKAWLGKVLRELGEETPYKNDGKRKTIEDIEPTADKVVFIPDPRPVIEINETPQYKPNYWNNKSHIEKIDWLREEIKNVIPDYYEFSNQIEEAYPRQCTCASLLWQCWINLSEARFWLGFELERIRNENK